MATVEFLVSGDRYVFLEVNPRLQVEHTVTEAVTGLDLVGLQLAVADGVALEDLNLPTGITASTGSAPTGEPAAAHGVAIQCRVNAEVLDAAGHLSAAAGTVTAFTPPTGAGVRVDTYLRPGTKVTGRYDTLLAKVIVHTLAGIDTAAAKAAAALDDLLLDGVATNRQLLSAILRTPPSPRARSPPTGWPASCLASLRPWPRRTCWPAPTNRDLDPDEGAVRAPMLGTVVSVPQIGDVIPPGARSSCSKP